jgi:FkbM family methyltransferase
MKRYFQRLVRQIEYTGTGDWIYSRRILSWTSKPNLVRQLPLWARLFCYYCSAYNLLIRTRTILFAHGLYNLLRRVDASRLPSSPCRIRWGDATLWVDLGDPGALSAISELVDGSPVSAALLSCLRSGDSFLDVGANQGVMSVLCARSVAPDGRVISIEPQAQLHACIVGSLAEAGVRHDVIRTLVSDQPGLAFLEVPGENKGEAHVSGSGTGEKIPVMTLDRILETLGPLPGRVVMKMDIEGFEVRALSGMRSSLRQYRPTLLIEVNPFALNRAGFTVVELWDELETSGYDQASIVGDSAPARALHDLPTDRFYDVLVLPTMDRA